MSKTIGANLLAHLAQETTTLAWLWKVTRVDATVLGFTSHDADLSYQGVTYAADSSAFTPSAIAGSAALDVDNLELDVLLDAAAITEADLAAGLYDHATVQLMLVNWSDLTQGHVLMRSGTLGEVRYTDGRGQAELRGLSQALQQSVGRVVARRCSADLGDARCGVTLGTYTVTGTVTAVTSRRAFSVTDAPAAVDGKLTWTSGANNGLSMEVSAISGLGLTLALPMPYDVAIGDGYSVYAGCDKNLSTCIGTYNNVVNFRGFPHLPGVDRALAYPDAH